MSNCRYHSLPDGMSDVAGSGKLKCKFCDRVLRNKNQYENHLRVHTGDAPFVCEVCDRAFKLKGNLVRHYMTHDFYMGKSKEQMTKKCIYCDFTTRFTSDMKRHVRNVHMNKELCILCNQRIEASKIKQHRFDAHTDFFNNLQFDDKEVIIRIADPDAQRKYQHVKEYQIKQMVRTHGFDVLAKRNFKYESLL